MKSQSKKSYIGDNSQRSGGLNEDYENNEVLNFQKKSVKGQKRAPKYQKRLIKKKKFLNLRKNF